MISYILFVAMLNVCLGFGVAVYLGRRYNQLLDDDEPWESMPFGESLESTSPDPAAEPELGDTQITDAAETAEPPADETTGPEKAPEPAHQKGSTAVAASALKINVEEFQEQLTELCDQLRGQTEAPEASEVETCLDSLSAATDEYLENRKRPQAALDQLHREAEFEKVGQQVQKAIQQYDKQAENLNAAVASQDRKGDLAEGCRNIAEKSDELLSSGHQLRDKLDEVAAKITESEGTADQTDPAARTDPQTGLFNRAGLEAYLAQWWENDPERIRPLGAAMIDADKFAAVNAQFGYKTGDQMLGAVGRLLETEIDAGVSVARFSGQRFFLLFPDGDARAATNGVEKVRQMIAKARFVRRDSESRLTVSCASTMAILDDTSASLITRVETALQEAKRYGRNRTFLHEGEYPAPVVPPQFTLDERRITL